METLNYIFESADELLGLGNKYLLIWAFFYEHKDDLESPILQRLFDTDFAEIQTCFLPLLLTDHPWVYECGMKPATIPELVAFSCGTGLCRIHDLDEFELGKARARDFCEQVLSLRGEG